MRTRIVSGVILSSLLPLACSSDSGAPGPVPVATVDVSPSSLALEAGATSQLTATVRDAAGNVLDRAVTWSSVGEDAATVSAAGLVTAVAEGEATITASAEGHAGTSHVTVAAPASPQPRTTLLVWDDAGARVLLFGGAAAGRDLNDLWAFDGSSWTRLSRGDGVAPSPRIPGVLAWDAARARLVLWGGSAASGAGRQHLTDTWEWDGTSWSSRGSGVPAPRRHVSGGYDRAHHEVLMFGGLSPDDQPLRETWAWDGQRWTLRAVITPENADASGPMVWSEARQTLVMLAGSFNTGPTAFWSWDGSAWSRIADGPPGFLPMPTATTAAGHVLLLHPGTGATLRWDGTTVSTVATGGPGQRFDASAVFDPVRQEVVLFGGARSGAPLGDTWRWDGTAWLGLPR